MMKGFADLPVVEQTFREATRSGHRLLDDGQRGPAELQNQTVNTQPLMLVAGVACWRAWRGRGGPMPAYFAGHSLGEYSALVAAESLRFEDALAAGALRAQAMQEAVPEGTGGIAAIVGPGRREAAAGAAPRPRRARWSRPRTSIPRPGRGRRPPRGGRARDGAREGAGRQAREDAADERAVALQPDEPAAERLRERLDAIEVRKPVVPVIHNRFVEASTIPRASARRWSSSSTIRCAGSRPCAGSPRTA
jgi:[acyl-carrier-protein] S-malonyltransferase